MKAHTMCTVDAALMDKARQEQINISGVLNEALLRKFGEIEDQNNPEIKEKKLREKISFCQTEKERLDQEEKTAQSEIKNLEKMRIEYAEKAKIIAQETAEKYKRAIEQEINYWPVFVKQGLTSSPRKRESHFKQRAKLLKMSYTDYLTEVAEPSQTKFPVVL